MAIDLREISAPPAPETDGLPFLAASVLLEAGDGLEPCAAQVHLLSFVSGAAAHRRISRLATSLAHGRQSVQCLPGDGWASAVSAATGAAGPVTSTVLALPAAQAAALDRAPALWGPASAHPVVVVTDDAQSFLRESGPPRGVTAVVQAPTNDVLGAAAVVWRLLAAAFLAPRTLVCVDADDVLDFLRAGRVARLCQPVWAPQTGLVFATPDEPTLLSRAKAVLMHLEFEHCGNLQTTAVLRRDVLARASADCGVLLVAPEGLFVAGECAAFHPVTLLCVEA